MEMMISEILLLVGVLSSIFFVFRRDDELEAIGFTYLYSLAHLLLVFPSLAIFLYSGSDAAEFYRANDIQLLVIWMGTSCYWAGLLGYRAVLQRQKLKVIDRFNLLARLDFREKASIEFVVILGTISNLAYALLATRHGGFQSFFMAVGFYQMELQGINVWLLYVARLVYICIPITAVYFFYSPSVGKFFLLIWFCCFPLFNVIFLFRRSDVVYLLIAIGLPLVRLGVLRFRPYLLTMAGIFVLLTIQILPDLRRDAITESTGYVYSSNKSNSLLGSVEPSKELLAALATIENAITTGEREYGSFAWNSLVQQFLPSSLVGVETKSSLLADRISEASYYNEFFDFTRYRTVAPMGFSEAFVQFDIFGFLIFIVFGAIAALVAGLEDFVSRVAIQACVLPILVLAATNDIYSTPSRIITWLIVYISFYYYTLFRTRSGKQISTRRCQK